jgi:hypothetical protein
MTDLNNNGKDDLTEIQAGFTQLFNDAKALNGPAVLADLKNGVAWTVNYVEALCDEAQQFLTAALNKVKGESATIGEAVSNALDILYNTGFHQAAGLAQNAIDQLKAIGSDVLTKIVALVTGLPAVAA